MVCCNLAVNVKKVSFGDGSIMYKQKESVVNSGMHFLNFVEKMFQKSYAYVKRLFAFLTFF